MARRMTVDTAALRARHPDHFNGSCRRRQLMTALSTAAAVLLLFGMAQRGVFDGAGCIGLHVAVAPRTLELHQASFIILMIVIAVAGIDMVSNQLRFALIGRRARLA